MKVTTTAIVATLPRKTGAEIRIGFSGMSIVVMLKGLLITIDDIEGTIVVSDDRSVPIP